MLRASYLANGGFWMTGPVDASMHTLLSALSLINLFHSVYCMCALTSFCAYLSIV
jgi:hypothetical protein